MNEFGGKTWLVVAQEQALLVAIWFGCCWMRGPPQS